MIIKYYLVIYACAYCFYHWTKETNLNSILFVFNLYVYIIYILLNGKETKKKCEVTAVK